MLLNIMFMEIHIHKHSLDWASKYSTQIRAPLRPKVNFFTINYLKHVAINFKLPNKAVSKTLQSTIKIIHIKHRFNIFNQHLAQRYITKTAVS